MKKFFTLACAAVLAISASAFTPVMPKMNLESATPKHKSFEKPAMDANIQKQANFAHKQNVKFGHRAAAATQDYTPVAPAFALASSYNSYFGDGSWMVQFLDASEDLLGYVILIGPSTENTIAGTYAVDLNNECYAEFVRGTGDTLISYVDGEDFTITYVGASPTGAPTYHISGTLSAMQTTTYNPENLVLDFDFSVDIAYDWYLYRAYDMLVQVALIDDPEIVIGADTIEVSTSIPAINYFSEDGVQTVEMNGITVDGTMINSYVIVEADSLEEGLYHLESSDYRFLMTVGVENDNYALYPNEESTVSFTKSANGDTTYVEAYLIASDLKVYHFVSKYYIITAIGEAWIGQYQLDEKTMSFYPGVYVGDKYLENPGYLELFAYHTADDGQYYTSVIGMDFLIQVEDNSLIGNYTIDNLYAGTRSVYDLLTGGEIYITDATFSITDTDMNGIGDHFEGDFTCNDGYIHHITMDFTYTPTGLFINNAADVKVEKVIKNGQLIIRKNGKEFNVMGAQL